MHLSSRSDLLVIREKKFPTRLLMKVKVATRRLVKSIALSMRFDPSRATEAYDLFALLAFSSAFNMFNYIRMVSGSGFGLGERVTDPNVQTVCDETQT